jgi:hypothetical protein
MMARDDRHVKQDPAGGNPGFAERCREGFFDYIESHPRTGWYIAAIATLNLLLNLVDAFDLF